MYVCARETSSRHSQTRASATPVEIIHSAVTPRATSYYTDDHHIILYVYPLIQRLVMYNKLYIIYVLVTLTTSLYMQ